MELGQPSGPGLTTVAGVISETERTALLLLVQAYAEAADEGRYDDMGALFTEDARLISPRGTTEGRENIARAFGGLARYDHTFHQLGQIRVWALESESQSEPDSADPSTAHGLVYCTAHHFTGDTDHVMFIRYHDIYVRDDLVQATANAWRFQERRLEVPVERDI